MSFDPTIRTAIPLAIAAVLALVVSSSMAESIWIEGEAPKEKSVTKHGWYDDVSKDGMSGGDWLSHYDQRRAGTATYEFSCSTAGKYTFWWRGNVLLSQVSYSLNRGEFQEISLKEKRGEYMISPRPDHRNLAWVRVGDVELKAGNNTLTIKFHSKTANHGGMDCFILTNSGFVPSGTQKPGNVSPGQPDEWFPVVFDYDRFSEQSLIDMSRYTEAPAGQHGFLKRDGAALRFERSREPIKFWGCGANVQIGQHTREQQTARIRYLKKHGVNMVRQHSVFEEIGPLQNGQFDAAKINELDWYFAELKKHGLYMTWSVFYPLTIGPSDGYDPQLFAELPPAGNGRRRTYGLVNIAPKLQELQWEYVRTLLLHRNPYTGLRYLDDPALAILETHNEDSIFWHFPLGDLRDPKKFPLHSAKLRQMWFTWVEEKYKTRNAVEQAWGRLRAGDAWNRGELELMGAYHFGTTGPLYEFQGQTQRAGDFIEFLAKMQRAFYEERERQLRDLGFQGVTITTAWKSGGPAADPANLWCDTAADMIDRHNYFGGGVGGHGIAPGKVNNGSHLNQPGNGLLSMGLYQVLDRPFCCTEWTQLPPNQWKLEAAPLIAFYGMGLQGWDASYHFTSSRVFPGDGWPNLNSYVTDTPHYIGQFPALSFALKHGHIKEASLVANRKLTFDQLFSGTDPLKQDLSGGYDAKAVRGESGTSPALLAVGRVTVQFPNTESNSQPKTLPNPAEIARHWDTQNKIIRSLTGELVWDYGRQVVLVQSEKTQGIVGRAKGQSFDLPGVTVESQTPFVSLLFTPLDNRELIVSEKILITALARDQQTGTEYGPAGETLTTIGGPPLLLEPVQAQIKLKGKPATKVQVLDVYGVPTGETVHLAGNGSFTIDGRYRTYYYYVER